MWFGTQDGLNCYNGYEITVFINDPADSSSLSHNWIWDIIEDDADNLWVATWEGLNKYDRLKGQFTRYLPDSADNHSISGARPASLAKDRDGKLWIGTWGGGLNVYLPSEDIFTVYQNSTHPRNNYPGDFIRKVFIDMEGTIWIGSWEGLVKCTQAVDGKPVFEHFKHDPADPSTISSNRIMEIEEDPDGTLWIGTLGGGLNSFDRLSGKFSRYLHDENNPGSISSNDITSIETCTGGILWIGTVSSGLNRFNKEERNFTRYKYDPDHPGTLSSDAVYSIFTDKGGILWIGAGGLNLYDHQLSGFHNQASLMTLTEPLRNRSVDAVFESRDECLWVGTEASGLLMISREKGETAWYRYEPDKTNSLSNNEVSSIAEDNEGHLWIGTRGGGLNVLDRRSGIITRIREQADKPVTAGLDYINGIVFDDEGILWIATSDMGIISFDPGTGHFECFRSNPDDPNTVSGDYLLRIYKDSRGDLWIGSWGGSLNKLDIKEKRFTRFLNDPDDPASLPGNIVHSIYECLEDGTRTLWIGTANGLARFDPDRPGMGFETPDVNSRFPSKSIYGTLKDANDNLWISSNAGLFKYNSRDGSLKIYGNRDGLPGNEFNAGAFLELGTGEFAFGSSNGLLIFTPDSIVQSSYEPNIVLTSFSVFNQKVYDGTRLGALDTLLLNYKQNFFAFEFASMDFSDPQRSRFQYKMEGIDADWIQSDGRHFASYTNIDPGHYRFIVMGTNRDGAWSSHEAVINLVITPPFWQRWWFRSLALLFILMILLSAHLYRLNRVREIERLRIKIASDLHDDIGSALTRINIHSQQMLTDRNAEHIEHSSGKINELTREVISTMSDIVWSIDARNDTVADLISRMQDFAHNTLSENEIRVSFNQKGLESNKVIPVLVRQNLYYIFKEAVNNIVKHSGAGAVDVEFSNTNTKFTMAISDNGKGYDPDKIKKGSGIRNMRMRAEKIGANLEITSREGVRICLRMKNL